MKSILRFTARLILLLTFSLQGCAGLPENLTGLLSRQTATITPTVNPETLLDSFSEQEIRLGIQEALDDYARAYNRNDPALLETAVDQENLPFRRMVTTWFDSYQQSVSAGQAHFEYQVQQVARMGQGFVLAHISAFGSLAADWTFRFNGQRWVISEPGREQVGKPDRVEKEHFIFETYQWNQEYNDTIIQLMEQAATKVKDRLGKLPQQKALVKILPGYSVNPSVDPNAMAYYTSSGSDNMDEIVVFSPISMNFGYYDPTQGWQAALEQTLVHEYTHMTHMRAFDNAGKLMDWFKEGLAETVSDSSRIYEVADGLKQNKLIPIMDETSTYNQQDLMHLYLLQSDVSLAYAEAESLVVYIMQTYGGMEAVWKLARADDDLQDFDASLQQSFDVTYADFDHDWREWLQKNFGS
jgi:hypothetical protein